MDTFWVVYFALCMACLFMRRSHVRTTHVELGFCVEIKLNDNNKAYNVNNNTCDHKYAVYSYK